MGRPPNLENREKILCAAYRLMYSHGYKGVSMDDVAKEAKVKKANLFHYYSSKESLGLAVFDYVVQGFQEKTAARLGAAADPVGMVSAMFDQACNGMKDQGCAGGCFAGNLAQELSDTNESMRLKVADHLRHWAAQMGKFFEEYKATGFFKKEFDSQATAQAVIALFEGAMLLSKASRDIVPLQNAKSMALSYLRSSVTASHA